MAGNQDSFDDVDAGNLGIDCHCCPYPQATMECPSSFLEVKSGYGSAYAPGPCGFYNPEDEGYYLVKTTTRTRGTRAKADPPQLYSCESFTGLRGIFCDIPYTGKIKTRETTTEFTYVAESIARYTQNEDGSCTLESPVETEGSYSLTFYDPELFPTSGSCTAEISYPSNACTFPEGGYIDELDPALTTEEVAYSEPWEPMSGETVKANAVADMTANFETEFFESFPPTATASVTTDAEGVVISAGVSKHETRWRVEGGNTGYLGVRWEIRDQNDDLVSSGLASVSFDPEDAGPHYITGPSVGEPAWPSPDPGDFGSNSLTLVVVETLCEPPPL
jgi:hypothetical protein